MASRQKFHAKESYIYPNSRLMMSDADHALFEFDESEIWNNGSGGNQVPPLMEAKKWIPSSKDSKRMATTTTMMRKKKTSSSIANTTVTSASLPVNVPDWRKILKDDYNDHQKIRDGEDQDFDNDEDGDRIPPHEYLARTRGASFSVHEGVGRTLKGWDLQRVRNAVWEKVGFED